MDNLQLNPLAKHLIERIDSIDRTKGGSDIDIDPWIAEVASWYENFRNALEYKEEEILLRTAIERIIKRRMFLGEPTQLITKSLIKELIWAKYFPDNDVPQELIEKCQNSLENFFELRGLIITKHRLPRSVINEWMLHLLSSELENILRLNKNKELISNFMFQIFKEKIIMPEEDSQTRDVQVFIAVKKAFDKEDTAMLRYGLFTQYFGNLNGKNIAKISDDFLEGYKEINSHLRSPYKDRVYSYIKKYTAPFLILEELFFVHKDSLLDLFESKDKITAEVLKICNARYSKISKKISRAILRSVIFIFVTKAVFALTVESAFEKLLYGHINWYAISTNTVLSPVLMVVSSLFINSPSRDNSNKIVESIKEILFEADAKIPFENQKNFIKPLSLEKNPDKITPLRTLTYSLLWVIFFMIGISIITYILTALSFSTLSQFVFIFFLAVVSFMCYRIGQIPKNYLLIQDKDGIGSILFNFFFMPFIQLGKHLTVGFSQINIFIFIFDYLIETPFKEVFSFLEQWFFFLRRQKELLD
jgi:hypothetical protein